MSRVSFEQLLAEKGLVLTNFQQDQFQRYYEELISWNEKINLTAITDREEVFMKHFYDSLSISFFCSMNKTDCLIDIGSGAGFPSLPLKIVFPHIHITIVDSLKKRISFLEHLTKCLSLSHVTCVHSRAEDAARLPDLRDQFDIATARAVAKLNVLNELCLPFVKPGGQFIAMKGSKVEEESSQADRSLRELRGQLAAVQPFTLPSDEEAMRHLFFVKKLGATPKKYPRKAGTPQKSPL